MRRIFLDNYGGLRGIWAVILFIGLVAGVVIGGMYLDYNGVRIATTTYGSDEAPKELVIPIKVSGGVEYDGTKIWIAEEWVDFCDVKVAKKEMRQEMRVHWKEMREGCKE